MYMKEKIMERPFIDVTPLSVTYSSLFRSQLSFFDVISKIRWAPASFYAMYTQDRSMVISFNFLCSSHYDSYKPAVMEQIKGYFDEKSRRFEVLNAEAGDFLIKHHKEQVDTSKSSKH